MNEYLFKLPDLGEGTVEAEIVAWYVEPGDEVEEGQHIVDVMTDKATVEVPAPCRGRVLRTTGKPGDRVAVGAELIAFEAPLSPAIAPQPAPPPERDSSERAPELPSSEPSPVASGVSTLASARVDHAPAPPAPALPVLPEVSGGPSMVGRPRPIASPAMRRRARETGIDLSLVTATGPRGRILMRDLDAYLAAQSPGTGEDRPAPTSAGSASEFEEIKVVGIRRVIAERTSLSKREIPHFAYVEEIDVDVLDDLRQHLNRKHEATLSVLPFVALALMRALKRFPQCNAHFDAEAEVVRHYKRVRLGIATQTPDGLKVPVVHDADGQSLWGLAAKIRRVVQAARTNRATRAELTGSTITITSLGRIGGIVSTPVINHPEVAIVGINRVMERAVVRNGELCTRKMMNLSSSFDHRFVDGFEAASFVQDMKERLEHPGSLFIDEP